MKRLSIQFRLAAWYFISVAAIIALLATGSWFTLKLSMNHAIDTDMEYRMAAVVPFIQSHSLNSRQLLTDAFAGTSDSSIVGVFVQITDDQSHVIYESDVLTSHHVRVMRPGLKNGAVSFATVGEHGWPVRIASQHVKVDSVGLTVHIVEPLSDMLNSLQTYALYFSALVVLALLFTTTIGYWMSRRVLAPVEQIRKEADALDPADLTTRIQVPDSDDELARLAQTLNAMLSRIEGGFRKVEQFTADASHELRAPLALIITAGEVSLRRERSREELTEVLVKIVREARHMSKLVEDLLGLARGDASRRSTELAPVDVAAILRELCIELTSAANAKGLTLKAALPQGAIRVTGESTSLRRLCLILIDNAIKYTETGAVEVALKPEDSQVTIIVRDTGIGIEQDALPHVFDRFWRADKVRSRAEGGSGLGLALASQIVQWQNGAISVQSELGSGSTFTVHLRPAQIHGNS